MNTNDLYQVAIADMAANSAAKRWTHGTARHTLPTGAVLICSVRPVAGRSVVKSHFRTTWHVVPVGEQYSKDISRERAADLLQTPETVN